MEPLPTARRVRDVLRRDALTDASTHPAYSSHRDPGLLAGALMYAVSLLCAAACLLFSGPS